MARPEGLAKLSGKWQVYIATLEKRIDSMEERWAHAVGEADDKTPVVLHDYGVTADRPLPEFGLIRFRLGPDVDHFIDVQKNSKRGGGITVRAGRALVVEPNASNTIVVHWSNMR